MFDRLRRFLGLSAIPQVFLVAAGLAILFVSFAFPFNDEFAAFFGADSSFTFKYFGWFYVLTVTGLAGHPVWRGGVGRPGHLAA